LSRRALFATCPNEAKDKRDAPSHDAPLACHIHALTEARASAGKADVLKTKCEIAAGKRPCP
jgi:hypothetical protein